MLIRTIEQRHRLKAFCTCLIGAWRMALGAELVPRSESFWWAWKRAVDRFPLAVVTFEEVLEHAVVMEEYELAALIRDFMVPEDDGACVGVGGGG